MKEYAVKDVPSVMILHHLGHILRYQVMDQLEKYELKAGQAGNCRKNVCKAAIYDRDASEDGEEWVCDAQPR